MENTVVFCFAFKKQMKLKVTDRFGVSVPVSDHITIHNPKAQLKMPLSPHNGHKADRLKSITSG